MSRSSDELLDVLVHVQSSLGDDLSLDALARRAGLSRGHFHRIFTARIGETPRAYVHRLRLERAALSLWLRKSTVKAVAEEVGFRRHETLTRAFRRRFGVPPSSVARGGISRLSSLGPGRSGRPPDGSSPTYALSPTRLVTLGALHLVFIRHTGPYEQVPDTLFDELVQWAGGRGIKDHRPLLGVGHDAPGITPPERLRFDAAMVVDGPMEGDGRVGYQLLKARRYAFTTHVGHYRTLPPAYAQIVRRLVSMPGAEFAGVPVVEMYHECQIDTDLEFNHTDLYLPLRSKAPHS